MFKRVFRKLTIVKVWFKVSNKFMILNYCYVYFRSHFWSDSFQFKANNKERQKYQI